MKVICNRGALLEALNVASVVVQARTPKPVLQCVKLTAADDRLTICATDMEVAIRYSDNQVQIEQPGETLVPADKFRDIVRESVDDTLSIEVGRGEGFGWRNLRDDSRAGFAVQDFYAEVGGVSADSRF